MYLPDGIHIETIKAQMNKPIYNEAKTLATLYSEIDKQANAAMSSIAQELGKEWTLIQSGGPKWQNGQFIYDNLKAPYNRLQGFSGTTRIYAFMTGDELVIQTRKEDQTKEVFRQPLEGEKNWSILQEALRVHYLEEIHNGIIGR